MGVACEFLVFVQGSRVQVMGNVCVVTKGRTLLVITQVSSGLKKSHILIFSKYKYLYVKIASLANVKSCVTIGKYLALYSLIGLPLRLSPLTKDTSMTTVFTCGVKLQEILSGLEKIGHTRVLLCLFSTFIHFSCSTWGVIN